MIQNIGIKIKLKNDSNVLYFVSDKNKVANNFEIKYNISIEETYSDCCSIFLTIKSCYPSCSYCTLSIEESNENSHNCIKCASNYFPFPEKSSNCFNQKEMDNKNIPYYLDKKKIFMYNVI